MRSKRRPAPIPVFPDESDELDTVANTPSNVATEVLTVDLPASGAVKIRAYGMWRNPANGDTGAYERVATFKRIGAGNAALVGAVSAAYTAEDQAAADFTLAVSGPTPSKAAVVVTGLVGVPLKWVVNLRLLALV